jgi:hypothetical protein
MINEKILEFRRVENNRAILAELLKQPVLQLALNAVRESGVPKSMPGIYAGVHPDTIVAHDYHRMVGINEAISTLSEMTKPVASAEGVQEEAPFVHSLPKHLRGEHPPEHPNPAIQRFISPTE